MLRPTDAENRSATTRTVQLEEGEVDIKRSRQFMTCIHTQILHGFRSRQMRPGSTLYSQLDGTIFHGENQIDDNTSVQDSEDL